MSSALGRSPREGASTSRLGAEESLRVAILSAYLSTGLSIDDNARLRGILESLTAQAGLTPANIAQLVEWMSTRRGRTHRAIGRAARRQVPPCAPEFIHHGGQSSTPPLKSRHSGSSND
ncbi:HTH domain-containing protein [Microbacterium ureisolvens]|uniref:HTH domain-containing protein n=1 Tax=Microbacterium ureisolvens TaxID=2781186 RepID=UPI0035B2E93B